MPNRHWKYWVVSRFEEVGMSKIRLVSALAGGACVLAAALWIVAGALPLTAQAGPDGAGVSVDLGSSAVMHRTGIAYPAAALAKGVEGTVVAQVTLDAVGNVTDARIMSGPDELRKAVLQAVLQWHFTRDAANGTRQVSVAFQAPEPVARPASNGTLSVTPIGIGGHVYGGIPTGGAIPGIPGAASPATPDMRVKSIDVYGLPDQARAELLASLPVHVGDTLTGDAMARISAAAKQYDEHLSATLMSAAGGGMDVAIVAPGATPRRPVAAATTPGGSTNAVSGPQPPLIRQVQPVYPPLAKQARIEGMVALKATIAKDGTVQDVTVVSGHPLLLQAAMDAVKQWIYQPTLLNGQPMELSTQINLNFALPSEPPDRQ
jgi:TonB family protein